MYNIHLEKKKEKCWLWQSWDVCYEIHFGSFDDTWLANSCASGDQMNECLDEGDVYRHDWFRQLLTAANHYTLGVIYHAQVDCTMLLYPWWNHFTKKCKIIIWSFSYVSVRSLGGERESTSNWHLLVVVPQPVDFCILKQWANRNAWLIFLCLIHYFLVRPGKRQLPFFSLFPVVMLKGKSGKKTRPLAISRKI